MYIPRINQMKDHADIVAFMQAYPFAIVVSVQEGLPVATHLPVTIHDSDEKLVLRAHFAKTNPQWRELESQEILVIFSEPHAYVSTRHYDKTESVPTWNYMAVHAYGQAEPVQFDTQPTRLEAILEDLIVANEVAYQAQWQGLSQKYRNGMMQGIVGVEITVTRLAGKAKLSQNKNHDEQARIAEALLRHEDSAAQAIGEMMQAQLTGEA